MTPHCPPTSANGLDGATKVIAMYEPLGLQADVDAKIVWAIAQLHDKAFGYYRQRRFAKAAKTFARAQRLCEQDPGLHISPKPAAILRQRCAQFVVRPPPLEWKSLGQWKNWNILKETHSVSGNHSGS